jgi:hypothetical protein
VKLTFVEYAAEVPRTEWVWTEECMPLHLNTMILIQRVPPGEYNRESLAAVAFVTVDVVVSDDLELLREYGGKW